MLRADFLIVARWLEVLHLGNVLNIGFFTAGPNSTWGRENYLHSVKWFEPFWSEYVESHIELTF